MGLKRKFAKNSPTKAGKASPKPKQTKIKSKAKASSSRTKSQEKKKKLEKANKISKQHKQKLLNAKRERQRQRNAQMMRIRRRAKDAARKADSQRGRRLGDKTSKDAAEQLDDHDAVLAKQFMREESFLARLRMRIEDFLASLIFVISVTLRSERTFDWLIFLANNLGLYQEYEINDYGQRISPRTGKPVLLSLGPIRVVQIVESANQVRSYWDPYIRDYLKNSNLTTDCWRANRMALQVALCMDDNGTMYDMPLSYGDRQDES